MRLNCHKPVPAGVVTDVDAAGEALVGVKAGEGNSDLETIFKAQEEFAKENSRSTARIRLDSLAAIKA